MNDIMDPSTNWHAVRVTSSTAIQQSVTAALLHLADPSSTPLSLHTLPSPSHSSSSSSFSIIPKNTHASLCKLISIVEIIKREFEDHQKAVWRIQDEKEQRKLNRKSSKGKKRAREEDDTPDNDNVKADESKVEDERATTTEHAAKDTTKTNKKSSKEKKQKKKDRPLLRIYQYNILDAYERLPGASTSQEGETRELSESESDASEDDGSNYDDNGDEDAKIEADLVKSKLKAVKSLDDAIKSHVIRARRRPRKKHTPYMKIILSTKKLPEYENYLTSLSTSTTSTSGNSSTPTNASDNNSRRPKDYTIQLPIKKKSRTRSKDSRKRKEKGKEIERNTKSGDDGESNDKITKEANDEDKVVVESKGKDSQSKKRKYNSTTESQISSEATQLSSQIVPSV